jgi:hypothetical protein
LSKVTLVAAACVLLTGGAVGVKRMTATRPNRVKPAAHAVLTPSAPAIIPSAAPVAIDTRAEPTAPALQATADIRGPQLTSTELPVDTAATEPSAIADEQTDTVTKARPKAPAQNRNRHLQIKRKQLQKSASGPTLKRGVSRSDKRATVNPFAE